MREIFVRIGEMKVSRDPRAVLAVYGLGSCICICAYDPGEKVAGMAHVLLPSREKEPGKPSGMYADAAISSLFAMMEKWGAAPGRIEVKLAGGSNVIETSIKQNNIGSRNTEDVIRIMRETGVPVVEADLGGGHSRTVRFSVESGEMMVQCRKSCESAGEKNEAT